MNILQFQQKFFFRILNDIPPPALPKRNSKKTVGGMVRNGNGTFAFDTFSLNKLCFQNSTSGN